MSRIGQLPIQVPAGVEVIQNNGTLTVKGPRGTLSRELHPAITIRVEDNKIFCERPSDSKEHRSLHGLTRTLVNNMVVGVTSGYERRLDVLGVGYRAEMQGKALMLQVGFSHPVVIEPMPGIEFEVGIDTRAGFVVSGQVARMPFVIVRGIDKELVGQQAANIRAVKPAEPYKGKGIRYAGEYVRRKAGKQGKAGGKK
ncbi:MAG: 50S ribosomal protein L6 [Armatimonadetes bacterium]|nr:50S ribosomal protein L6 [Armatimonadota bacterium]